MLRVVNTDEFLQYLNRHDCLRDLEATFTGLVLRTRLRQDAQAELATVTAIRAEDAARTEPVDRVALEAAAFEAAG